jgi:hypothetical protein
MQVGTCSTIVDLSSVLPRDETQSPCPRAPHEF